MKWNKMVRTAGFQRIGMLLLCCLVSVNKIHAQNNLALMGTATSSGEHESHGPAQAIDGNSETFWESQNDEALKWIFVVLPGATEIQTAAFQLARDEAEAPYAYALQTYINGRWENRAEGIDQQDSEVSVAFEKAILTDRIRLAITCVGAIRIQEFEIYGQEYVDENAGPVRKILGNQSGYNRFQPKRFTAPDIPDNTPFAIVNVQTEQDEFEGKVMGHIGDFTDFNPQTNEEFIIKIDTASSYPFRIGPYWLERVSYQNMVDFMIGARHYVGTTDEIRTFSWAWRDGDFFNWALQSLIAQYLSHPEAYNRIESKISYRPNSSFPAAYKGKWGALEPCDEAAPDIVKLIHWDVDVKISQGLEHEHQKAELAHFLYAYPYLKTWLPKQNFDVVYQYLTEKWAEPKVREASTTQYDKSPDHNLLALKTKMGTHKGELPPGHSVIPNLMMYEVAQRQGEADAEKYFTAAHKQMEWMIANLDWKEPMTTKGQRMSEHITMRAFAYFYHQYPERRPKGLYDKIHSWAEVAISRSDNMWDFRKFTDNGDWVPSGWNETGNVLGFPAAVLAAKSVMKEEEIQAALNRLAWSHFDNAFGRNPTGRHFSYDGPREIEGVDLGWYNAHHGGIGLLEPVPFVFDGSPKTNHYPNHPEIGNLGWTEGWVQFNTAFNTSMAYLANSELELELARSNKKTLLVRIKTPLNFSENEVDTLKVQLISSSGEVMDIVLQEEGKYSPYLSTSLRIKKRKITAGKNAMKTAPGDKLTVSYGFGYFEKSASLILP